MNKRLLHHYNNELVHLRQHSADFAREFPKIAGRLALDPDGKEACQDPFVERLLEGFAYLTARIQLKFEAEFPRLTEALLESVYPHYLAPLPSMLIAAFEPDLTDGGLADGYPIPRQTALRGNLGSHQTTPCEFRTAHEVKLWPLEIIEAAYITREIGTLALPSQIQPKAALRIRLNVTAGLPAKALKADELVFYLRGSGDIPYRVYEQIFANAKEVVVQAGSGRLRSSTVLAGNPIAPVGFEDEESLLPRGPRTFGGFRLLREYFAFAQRFLFFKVRGLGEALKKISTNTFDLVIALNALDTHLENQLDATAFALFCTPAINLFPKRLDRIPLTAKFPEYQVIADRARPLDFEIYEIQKVTGIGGRPDEDQKFSPFYFNFDRELGAKAYFTVHRVPRVRSAKEREYAEISKYGGSEVYISIVDGNCVPWKPEIGQLALSALCTNRHLPIQMPIGSAVGRTDFHIELGGPIVSTRCIAGPTEPKASCAAGDPDSLAGDLAWRIISHLSLNYLSLLDESSADGAAALREMLSLYTYGTDIYVRRQIEGLMSVEAQPIIRRIATSGPIAFGRGLEVSVLFRESGFAGSGVYLMGAVLERFFAKYVSINSFTETVLTTVERGEVKRWTARPGKRGIL